MCLTNKLKSFLNIKTVSVFALALALGLTSNLIFGRYIFRYSITETFTKKEVEAKLNKKVRASFTNKSVTGTVVSSNIDDSGANYVSIIFDEPIVDSPTTGKIYKLDFGKEMYTQSIIEINESE